MDNKESSPGEQKTHRAVKSCAEWLNYCLEIGWDKSQLDALEKLWWEHHDNKGRLIKAKLTPSEPVEQRFTIEDMKASWQAGESYKLGQIGSDIYNVKNVELSFDEWIKTRK